MAATHKIDNDFRRVHSASVDPPVPDAGPKALEAIMVERKWSVRRAAREIGVSPSTLSRWLKRTRSPSKPAMRKLDERLGIAPGLWI